MKYFLVFILFNWLQSTDATESTLATCACTRIPTLSRSSSMQPMAIIWPGKCFHVSYHKVYGFRWIRLAKGSENIFALTKALEIGPCQDLKEELAVNDIHSKRLKIDGQYCPAIFSRRKWGARQPKKTKKLSTPVKYAVVHHSETPQCSDENSCIKRMRSIQNDHMDNNHWDDIGYNFVVGGDGNVYEGRGWDTVGAHAYGYNRFSIGICVIGDYMEVTPNTATLHTLKRMIDCLRLRNKVTIHYLLRGHRDLGKTNCPGDKLYNIIKSWPHYRG